MIPGSTALGTSAAVLSAVKTTGAAEIAEIDLVARALRETGHADVYEILFEFGSDRIRDSITSDAYNLELSQRRAAAVKTALTTTYAEDTQRLTTAGFGES